MTESSKAEAARSAAKVRTKKRERSMDQRVESEAAAGALPSVSFTPRT